MTTTLPGGAPREKADAIDGGIDGGSGGVTGGGAGTLRGVFRVLGLVRPQAGRLLLAALAGMVAELCALGLIAAAAWLIARAAERPPLAAVSLAIVAVRGFAMGKGVFRYLERLAGHDVALRALAGLRGRVYEALTARRTAVRDGDAVAWMVADVDAVQDLVLRCLLPIALSVVAGGAAVGLCAVLLPAAGAVLAAGLVAAAIAIPVPAVLAARRSAARLMAQRDLLAVRGLDVLDGAADLAAFGATGRAVAAAGDAARRLGRLEHRAAAGPTAATAAGVIAQGVTVILVTLVALRAGTDTVRLAVLALASLVAFETALSLTGAAQRLAEVAPAARRLAALLETPAAPAPARPRALPAGPPSLCVRGVRAGHHGIRALDGVDLHVAPGSRIAIVGASGAGKSTLLSVLSGETVPEAGTVTLDGHDLDAYDPGDVRRVVRGLTQDAHVFAATIRANVALARPGASEPRLTEAARRSRLDEVLETLPDGWDTVVGEGGRGLSGGQRQRLLLARALLADPPVLVLDEPVEGLDTATGDAVIAELLAAPGDGALVLVTHRLTGLDAADEIIVLDHGRVVQRGGHGTLLAGPGPYRDLWEAERLAEEGLAHRPV